MAKKLHTFMGETPGQALKKAQDTFGMDILLVDNKEIRKKTMTQPALYEVVVAVDDEVLSVDSQPQVPQETIQSPNSVQKKLDEIAKKKMEQKKQEIAPKIYDEVTLQLSDAVKQISEIVNVPSNMPSNPKSIPTLQSQARPYPSAIPNPIPRKNIDERAQR